MEVGFGWWEVASLLSESSWVWVKSRFVNVFGLVGCGGLHLQLMSSVFPFLSCFHVLIISFYRSVFICLSCLSSPLIMIPSRRNFWFRVSCPSTFSGLFPSWNHLGYVISGLLCWCRRLAECVFCCSSIYMLVFLVWWSYEQRVRYPRRRRVISTDGRLHRLACHLFFLRSFRKSVSAPVYCFPATCMHQRYLEGSCDGGDGSSARCHYSVLRHTILFLVDCISHVLALIIGCIIRGSVSRNDM